MPDQVEARPNGMATEAPADPWMAELAQLHQVERQAEQLVAAGQAVIARMERLLGQQRRLQEHADRLTGRSGGGPRHGQWRGGAGGGAAP